MALQMGFLVTFGLQVQRDYVRSWELQRILWMDIVRFVPDMEAEMYILIEPNGLEDPVQIDANTWNLNRMLPKIYNFPVEWSEPPSVRRLVDAWRSRATLKQYEFVALDYEWQLINIEDRNSALLITEAGRVVERLEYVTLEGNTYSLNEIDTQPPPRFSKGVLHPLIFPKQGGLPDSNTR
jgi:hypothetical protein